MASIPWTKLIIAVFSVYVLNSVYVIYTLFNPEECGSNKHNCLLPSYNFEDFQTQKVSVFVSRSSVPKENEMELVWESKDAITTTEKLINVTLPFSTRRNGSLFAYVFLHPARQSPFERDTSQITYQQHKLTKYALPKENAFNLINGIKEKASTKPVTHMHSKLSVYLAMQNISFDRYHLPADLYRLFRTNGDGRYLPLLYIDGLSTLERHLLPVQKDTSKLPLTIYFKPVSFGRMRIWTTIEMTLGNFKSLGFSDKDVDEVKGLFTDTNLYFLGMTFFIALVHMLFDVLAFKNDVSFWKDKKSMSGMSTRTVVWRCISTSIIFLYLMDEKTSLLVLIPSGIGALIEFWKVTKALKVKISFASWKPSISFGERTESEKVTEEFDEQAMKYLSYALYPLLVATSVYSLVYQPHSSWYSWVIRSLVNGVYAFGFLFMLPQLFVNYKLKSVAHLPWRAFTYKAFNTFIDDVFAFIITMPTAHRLACFRDDIVFLVYLYQRWLYPVDKSRTNEFGMSFDDKQQQKKKKTSVTNETKKNK